MNKDPGKTQETQEDDRTVEQEHLSAARTDYKLTINSILEDEEDDDILSHPNLSDF